VALTVPGTARRTGGAGLLEQAVGYALGAVQAVTPPLLARPTPCREWDLRALLRHLNDSLAVLQEGIDARRVGLDPAAGPEDLAAAADPAQTFRDRAGRLVGAWSGAGGHIAIADLPLEAGVVASAGAVEIAVHGWDVAQACGHPRPVPHELATELLRLCPLLVAGAGRYPLFAAPVPVAADACPSDRLVAHLGRNPRH
jgi:uncharacterized protein (TIGR03086 family)